MATKKKSKKTGSSSPIITEISPGRKKEIRLGIGIFFLLFGAFTCFSIISYFVTWETDQDKLLTNSGLYDFVFSSKAPVANWGGR